MAISVDRVYQKVLALANKEQRGYITPQEFNLFADSAQMEIFEQYFYDLDQFERRLGNDIIELINDKIEIFKTQPIPVSYGSVLPLETHKIDDVWGTDGISGGKRIVVQRIDRKEVQGIQSSPLLTTTLASCYYVYNGRIYFLNIYPNIDYRLNIIRKPTRPNWTYVINPTTQNALYQPNYTDHQDFELHTSEEQKLVTKILQLAGVNMKDPNLVQLATQKEVGVIQQQKQ